MELENNSQYAVIVSSIWSYRDVWEPFFKLFFEYWPDCPYEVYLVTDGEAYPDERVKTILLEEDLGWARNMRFALGKIGTPYFMLFMEDFLMIQKVDTERIKTLVKYFREKNLDYLRLYPSPGPDKNFDPNLKIGEINLDAPYRLSLMTALWKTQTFLELLRDDENAWQMELQGSERARNEKYKFYSVLDGHPATNYFSTALKKGVWLYDAVKWCERHGIKVDDSLHPIEGRGHYLLRKVKALPYLGRVVSFTARRLG